MRRISKMIGEGDEEKVLDGLRPHLSYHGSLSLSRILHFVTVPLLFPRCLIHYVFCSLIMYEYGLLSWASGPHTFISLPKISFF